MRRITISCLALALILLGFTYLAAAQNVSVQLTAYAPIQIPGQGGSFNYIIAATNNDSLPQQATAWCTLTLPDSNSYGPVLGPVTITLNPGQTLERQRTQNIPGLFPPGNYSFNAFVGVYPDSIWDSDAFPFDKLPAPPGGTEIWVVRYNGTANDLDDAWALAVDAQGNVYVTGYSAGSGTLFDYATIKYNSEGVEQWVARYNGPGNDWDEPCCVAVDGNGNVYVTGSSDGNGTAYDYCTIKYNSAGEEQWVARYDGPGNDYDEAHALAVDRNGNVYVTGQSHRNGTIVDYATIKYNSDGVQQWVARYNVPEDHYAVARGIALDEECNVYITGSGDNFAAHYDIATIKYDSAGIEQWATIFNGPGNDDDDANAIAVDGDGSVYVTGGTKYRNGPYWPFYNWDFATIKYDSRGVQQWVAYYNGPADSTDLARSIALDGRGNVYVLGRSIGHATCEDYATIKYDAAGAEQWIRRFGGFPFNSDWPTSLALDRIGNISVTGFSDTDAGPTTNYDYATIKYDPAGMEQWIAYYNGPIDYEDHARAIAVDRDGNAYVTGNSYGVTPYMDYCTIKYSGGNIANWLPAEATVLGQPLPQECRLEGNYPNPFNASTVLSYQLPVASHVRLEVFDIAGRAVGAHGCAPSPLVDGWRPAGEHELTFDASNLPSGMYVYRIQARQGASVPGNWTESGKMVLLK